MKMYAFTLFRNTSSFDVGLLQLLMSISNLGLNLGEFQLNV